MLTVPTSQQLVAPEPAHVRRPEELDVLAAELNHLAADVVEEDSDDEGGTQEARDGTLLASEPPKPL